VFPGTRHHGEFSQILIDISQDAIHIGSWVLSTGIGQRASNAVKFFQQYHHINVDFESEGEAFSPSCFNENVGYFRFDAEGDLYTIGLADYKMLEHVEQLAKDFVASAHGKKLILDCAVN
jgi:hypothetical protein